MEERDERPRAGVPLVHKLIAFTIALAVAAGVCGWQRWKSLQAASTAELAFDADGAGRIDPGLASAQTPAVATADTILNDSTTAGLAKEAGVRASAPAAQLGEFRSRLELTQPSARTLRVRYIGGGADETATVTNAVAEALAAWTPAHGDQTATTPHPAAATPPTAPAAPQPAADQGRAAIHSAPAPTDQPEAQHPYSDGLGAIGSDLESTRRELSQLAGGGRGSSSYSESRQQQILKAQVKTAARKLDALRGQAAREGSSGEIKSRLGEVHQALLSIFASAGYGFNAAGMSVRQLGRERSQLVRAIGVVNEQRAAIARIEAAHPAHAKAEAESAPATAAKAAPAPPAAQAASSIQEQSLPAAGGATAGASSPTEATAGPKNEASPLSVVRLADPGAARMALTPAMLRGLLIAVGCGLFYFGIAWLISRVTGSHASYTEESAYPQRFITPSGPSPAIESRNEPLREASWTAAPAAPAREPEVVGTARYQRASFAFEGAPKDQSSDRGSQGAVVPAEEKAAAAPDASAEGTGAADEDADPLTNRIRQGLSGTSFGRMFEGEEESDLAAGRPRGTNRDRLVS